MALVKKLTTIGNSKGIILPQIVLDQLEWEGDAEIELKIEGKKLILAPAKKRYATDEEFKSVAKRVLQKHGRLNKKLAES